jgi:uncharacterized protein (TIGR02118 family)
MASSDIEKKNKGRSILKGNQSMIKQIYLIKRKPGMSFDEFKKYYLEVHAPLAKKLFPEIRKYIINFALQRGKETVYDAITEVYYDDLETIIRLAKSDTYKNEVVQDEERFMDRSVFRNILTEEYPQK